MTDRAYHIEVQSDFLEKITRATPVSALSELIWNGLDADASVINIQFTYDGLESMETIIISDNGTGMTVDDAMDGFRRLGGSWKKLSQKTKQQGRFLHGQDGRGRFKAFALGNHAEWEVTYEKQLELWTFSIIMDASDITEVRISEENRAPDSAQHGVVLTISELKKDYRLFTTDKGIREFTELLALYLADYKDISISVGGIKIDSNKEIASRHHEILRDINVNGVIYEAYLEIIEWKSMMQRTLYLCNESGFPGVKVEKRFYVGNFRFSAYIKSEYISKLQTEGVLELAEMNETMAAVIEEAHQAITHYFRSRAAEEAQSVVAEWKEEKIYPYEGEAATHVEVVERQVFDIVAVNVAQYMPEFAVTPQKNKALHLRLLRQAIEKSPKELQLILSEVLNLPKKKQEDLAALLHDVSLAAIIGSAKIVADRLKFITGLESVLFDIESKKRMKERSQLHRILAENCWLFGEEFNLTVDDQSLTEVLRKHKALLGDDIVIDEPVRHITKERGIIDLMLSRSLRRHKANDLAHLIVELKAPNVKINQKEVGQIEGYAVSVTQDERFRSINTTWDFWVISDDYGEYAKWRIAEKNQGGLIYKAENVSIYVKTWGQVIEENRARLQFFQEKLEYRADKDTAISFLNEHYARYLQDVLISDSDKEMIVEED